MSMGAYYLNHSRLGNIICDIIFLSMFFSLIIGLYIQILYWTCRNININDSLVLIWPSRFDRFIAYPQTLTMVIWATYSLSSVLQDDRNANINIMISVILFTSLWKSVLHWSLCVIFESIKSYDMADQLLWGTTTAGKSVAIYKGSEYIFKGRSRQGTTMRCISQKQYNCYAKIKISLTEPFMINLLKYMLDNM